MGWLLLVVLLYYFLMVSVSFVKITDEEPHLPK